MKFGIKYHIFIIITLSLVIASHSHSAPKAELWERWTAHDPESRITVDHRTWDALLGRYLVVDDPSGVNLFRYKAVSTLDRAALLMYLDELQAVPVSGLSRPEQLAFWINLYNAWTVQIILEHYPVTSIRDIDISPGLFSDGPWGARFLKVEGVKISLDDIEHRILRPIWKDARIHYAVNCAALGCPDLQGRAFRSEVIDGMLDDGARGFINHARGVSVDGKGRLALSSIYKWFRDDFGSDLQDVLGHIKKYASDDLKDRIPADGKVRVRYSYDWKLNEATEEAQGSRQAE